jgi:hypothetical protein
MSGIVDALRGCAEIDIRPHNDMLEEAADEISRLRQQLFDAQQALLAEGIRADDMQRQAAEEIREMRANPLAALYGDFYFAGPRSELYVVSIGSKQVALTKREGRICYPLRQIPAEEYAKRVKDQV